MSRNTKIYSIIFVFSFGCFIFHCSYINGQIKENAKLTILTEKESYLPEGINYSIRNNGNTSIWYPHYYSSGIAGKSFILVEIKLGNKECIKWQEHFSPCMSNINNILKEAKPIEIKPGEEVKLRWDCYLCNTYTNSEERAYSETYRIKFLYSDNLSEGFGKIAYSNEFFIEGYLI